MATSWTDVSLTSTSDFKQLEPHPGFGNSPFGDEGVEDGIKIHLRGFGDPKTDWSEVSGNTTIWS